MSTQHCAKHLTSIVLLKKLLASQWGKKYGFNFSGEKTEVQRSKVICSESVVELALVLLQGIHCSHEFLQT